MNSSLRQFWEHFNFDHEEIENGVDDRRGSYQGLPAPALYTSRGDLLSLFQHPLVGGTFVDLGCGTGESCLLYGSLFPERKAVGMEFQQARLEAGRKIQRELGLASVELIEGDLLHDPLPQGETYFFYLPTGPVLDRVLFELAQRERMFKILAIESHGDLFPRLEKENWLTLLAELPLLSPRHHPMARIYGATSAPRRDSLLPHDLSFQVRFLVIDQGEVWLGESEGLEWNGEDSYQLKTPPRTIRWNSVREILRPEELTDQARLAVKLRRLGELSIKTRERAFYGHIRKIILSPTFRLEISSGEKVEWDEIVTICQGTQLCYESC